MKDIFRIRGVLLALIMVLLAILLNACGGGGGPGGPGHGEPVDPGGDVDALALGSWSGSGVSFTVNEGSYWIDDLSVTYSGRATGTICTVNYDRTETIGASIPVSTDDWTFIYDSLELTIEGVFTNETSAELELSWSFYNDVCDVTVTGSDVLYADHTTVPPEPGDDHGDAPSSATALQTNGRKVSGEIQAKAGGDLDYFRFFATTGNTYTIETSDLEGGLDTVIVLYSTNGTTQIDEDDDGADEALASRIVWTCQVSGTYYVSVGPYSENNTGRYNIAVSVGGQTPPVAGNWSGPSGFGEIELVVASDSSEIESIAITFNDFSCGGVTSNGTITQTGSWAISNNRFTANIDWSGASGDRSMEISGTFEDSGTDVSGTYEADYDGSICDGNWDAEPQ